MIFVIGDRINSYSCIEDNDGTQNKSYYIELFCKFSDVLKFQKVLLDFVFFVGLRYILNNKTFKTLSIKLNTLCSTHELGILTTLSATISREISPGIIYLLLRDNFHRV